MELRHLRYFTALAEELNFTRAAEKVHVTQSTLSHQIKQLESELGQPLFDRNSGRVLITEAGENLLVCARKVLRDLDDGVHVVKAAAHALTGVLRVAATSTFGASRLPDCLAAYNSKHPGVRIAVTELSARGVEQAVASGSVEVGIGYMPTHTGLSFEPLYMEEMVLAVSGQHPLALRRRISMVELHREPLVLNTPESATRQMLDQHFASVRAEPNVVAEMDATYAMLGLVRATCIGAIVSEHALVGVPYLHRVALENPTPLRTPGLLWQISAPRSAACRSFVAMVRSTVSRASVKRMPHFRGSSNSL
jgi:LysR family transcriptional regulator, cyn operon transcriptional activator